jgi:hypothetical protein
VHHHKQTEAVLVVHLVCSVKCKIKYACKNRKMSRVVNSLTCKSSQMPQRLRWDCHTANSKLKLCATRNSRSSTSEGDVLGILDVYASSEIGLLVVFVARNNAVNLGTINNAKSCVRTNEQDWNESRT